ncbi:MAG: hypothetical protein ACTHK7_03125, partial [Aureliella sp.]
NCDRPYHFYQFANFGQDFPAVLVPSKKQLENYLTFDKFLESLKSTLEDLVAHEGLVLRKALELKSIDTTRKPDA